MRALARSGSPPIETADHRLSWRDGGAGTAGEQVSFDKGARNSADAPVGGVCCRDDPSLGHLAGPGPNAASRGIRAAGLRSQENQKTLEVTPRSFHRSKQTYDQTIAVHRVFLLCRPQNASGVRARMVMNQEAEFELGSASTPGRRRAGRSIQFYQRSVFSRQVGLFRCICFTAARAARRSRNYGRPRVHDTRKHRSACPI